jgi:type I restriction-modification system DNA methylase subunit
MESVPVPAPVKIRDLIALFERNAEDYLSPRYKEEQAKHEFINPFFRELGWDMDNTQGFAEAYKDVIYEASLKIGADTKAPDYCFRVGGTPKFYLEAKRPEINLHDDAEPAYQLRRYGWSKELPLSILTDFEEFAVYDCTVRPKLTDKASTARITYLRYEEYSDKWDEIAGTYSRDAVLKGSFDKFAQSKKAKRGTATVDDAFLEEIEKWRELLAKNLAAHNELDVRALNHAVQMTLDRVIFLRICEDRGIEPYGQLRNLQNHPDIYENLVDLYRKADQRYNSGLFHFKREPDRPEEHDNWTPKLVIDDKALKEIFKGLYYPDGPYEFSVIPVEILGQVYERFLGKVIRLTAAHHVKIEEKPEVKKAGGVYYTPSYIVDYIVENTVGNLLYEPEASATGRTAVAHASGSLRPISLKQAAKLRILDPACGSGSFLLGAYQYLLKWHLEQYVANEPAKRKKEVYQTPTGDWRLTAGERKRILLNNIYGVDIDPQAVEVTKLSLLLKVLEGESQQSLDAHQTLFHERVLPDLAGNIKCGNSLIGPDFYDGQKLSLFDEEQQYRINMFDWQAGFPEIMKAGGFDAIIGNPPYVDIKALPAEDVAYLFSKFISANNRVNLFAAFIERGLSLVRAARFRFSMIVPTAVLTQESYKALRKDILDKFHIHSVVRLPNESFGSAAGEVKVDTVILVFEQSCDSAQTVKLIAYSGYERISTIDEKNAPVNTTVPQSSWASSADFVWAVNTAAGEQEILNKCDRNSVPLEQCAEFSLGLTPYDKYKGHTQTQIKNQVFHASSKKAPTYKKLLSGNDVMRYLVIWNGERWINYGPWLGAPREQRFFTERRILVKQIIDWTTKRIWATITADELYNTQNAFNLLAKPGWCLEYLLAIINSRLLTFYHRKRFLDEFKMRFQKILIKDCRRFPIHIVNLSDPAAKSRHDRMVQLVDRMLALHPQLAAAKTPHAKESLQRQIDATDGEIDKLVYELYGLTEDEIRVVEGQAQVQPAAELNGEPPAEEEWTDAKNDRRAELIERKIAKTITPDEESEFEQLQAQLRHYRDRVAPLPLEEARRLHQELVELAKKREANEDE